MSIQRLTELWNESVNIEWWKMLLIGIFFLTVDFVIFIAFWYVRQGVAIEYGYPKRNAKHMRKRLTEYSASERLLLVRLTKEAENKGVMLYINLVCHFMNMIAFAACTAGFVGCMVTLADGWSIALLTVSEIGILIVTVALEFVPHMIWLPSERRRYNFRRK